MGPALETLLTAIGLVLLGIGLIAFVSRPFWPRIVRFFRAWYERDKILEEQKQLEIHQRRQAEQEIEAVCNPDEVRTACHLPQKQDATPERTVQQGD